MRDLIIYRILNTRNGKCYIGQSTQGLVQRKSEHVSRFLSGQRDHKLYRAMRKYGIEAFEFDVLCRALREEDLDALEVALVAQHESFGRRGYNMTPGGGGVTQATRDKISAALKGRDHPWVAKGWITRRANGNASTRPFVPAGENNPNARAYMVQAPGGRLFAVTGLRAFCKENALDHKTLIDTMKGVQRHHKGFVLLSPLGTSVGDAKASKEFANTQSDGAK